MSDTGRGTWNGNAVVTASMEPTAVLDRERYVSVNQAFADLFGLTGPDDLRDEPWREWFVPDARSRFEDVALPTCQEVGQWQGELTAQTADASSFDLEMSLAPLDEDRFICSARPTHTEDRTARGETPAAFLSHLFDAIDDIVYILDEEGQSYYWNQTLVDTTGYSHEEIEGMHAKDFVPEDHHEYVPGLLEAIEAIGDQRVELDVVTKDGARIPHEFKGTTHTDSRTGENLRVGIARDVSERRERERRLERQRDELETLDRINELILEITRELFDSLGRSEIERTVCDSLVASDLYQAAWIARPDPAGDELVPRATAGVDDEYVESNLTGPETDRSRDPGRLAFHTGELVSSQDVRGDPTFEGWRRAAVDHGVRSAAAVPLGYGETTYGILAVYSARSLAFSRREQDGFESLGDAIGFVINAIENRQLLFADTIVELEFEVTDADLVFVRVSDRLECELTITGFVESDDGDWSVYALVDGSPPTEVRDVAANDATTAAVRVITEEGDHGLVEFVLAGRALDVLTEHGGILTSGHVDDGTGRFIVEAHQTADTRALLRRLQAVYPDSTLVAHREFERPAQKATEVRQSLAESLTDRQQEALRRAYLAGYFDWPRTSTAVEVSETMGVSETTFHYHLRKALDTLVANIADLGHPDDGHD